MADLKVAWKLKVICWCVPDSGGSAENKISEKKTALHWLCAVCFTVIQNSNYLSGTAQGFIPPTFLAVDVRTLNVQPEIFKVLMKDGEFTCFDDILAKIKQLSEAEKCMITEIITLCKLLLVNPATSAAGERSFSSARRLKTWLVVATSREQTNFVL